MRHYTIHTLFILSALFGSASVQSSNEKGHPSPSAHQAGTIKSAPKNQGFSLLAYFNLMPRRNVSIFTENSGDVGFESDKDCDDPLTSVDECFIGPGCQPWPECSTNFGDTDRD